MSGSGRRGIRSTLIICCATALLAVTGIPGSARADDASAGSLLEIGTAAAYGAADGASQAMATAASDGMSELGRVALGVPLPPPMPTQPAAVPQGSRWTWDGWQSGAAGTEAADGGFAGWRGEPLGIVGVWCDTTAEAQTDLDAVADYDSYDGSMDVAVGALVEPETWQQAAAGDFVDRWTTAIKNLRAMRQGKGTTYIRIAHEMNGNWMTWSVTSANLAAYKAGYRLYASIVRKEFPQARLTWSPNYGNHSDVSMDAMYPGSDVVDVIGPDVYDGWPEVTSAAVWQQVTAMWQSPGSPQGLAAWQQWAAAKDKPIALPEWGLPYGDHPAFIQGVHDELEAHAAAGGRALNAGRFVYDVYFNAQDTYKIYNGPNTVAGAMYKSLHWGS